MFEAKTYLQSRERTQKREVDFTENLKQHETFKRLVEHSTRVSRGDWLFRKQNVDEKIREEIRMEEMLRKKEEREEKEAMKRREEALEELEEKRRRNGGSGGNGGVSAFPPEDDPLSSSADGDEWYVREMKEKLDALRSEREQEMTKEMKRRERDEERRRVRGLTESREDVVGRAVDEDDYGREKREEIEKLTRALDVRLDLNRQTEKRRAMEREREEEKKKEREFADNFERERVRRERDLLNRKRKEARELRQ